MKENVLITGGTGLIGKRLSQLLVKEGFEVSHLSRRSNPDAPYKTYTWDLQNKNIEAAALESSHHIVHLAGAGIADKSWTSKRKKEIRDSRVQSGELIAEVLSKNPYNIKSFIAASGISIYGIDTGDRPLDEDSPAEGEHFLRDVSVDWEQASQLVQSQAGIRTVMLRTGIVLSPDGGALPKLIQPIKMGAGAALASGKQYMSWIHLDDLCAMYIHAIKNTSLKGAYNAVGPKPVTNAEMTKVAARVLKMPLILPNVPTFALRLMLGQLADLVIGGNWVSSEKITQTGFNFQYPELEPALKDLLT
ncbi:MAG: TIGR01777 family oxidoreductase [Bacteroidota bacterium]